MKKIFAFLLLLCSCGMAFADSSNTSSVLDPAALTHYTDMSVYYLSQIFGTVGNTLTGNSSQIMGRLFYELNWGIFLISAILIGYAIFLSSIRLASEGVTMQSGKSTLFTLFKLAIGVALVIPNGGTGYSLIQDIVIKVVVKGVGLADSIWSSGLQYLNDGGVVWTQPSSANPTNPYASLLQGKNIEALLGNNNSASQQPALAAQIFQNEVCMIGSRNPLGTTTASSGSNSIAATGATRPYYDVQADDKTNTFNFPGLTDPNLSGNSCGSITWNVYGACNPGQGGNATSCAIARDAMSKLIVGLMPAAHQYYCYEAGNTGICQNYQTFQNVNSGLSSYLVSALVDYYPAIRLYANMKQQQVDASKKGFIQSAEAEGWIMAGRYYWDVMQFTGTQSASNNLASYAENVVKMAPGNMSMAPNLKAIVDSSTSDFVKAGQSSEFVQALAQVTNTGGSAHENENNSSGNIVNTGAFWGIIGGTALVPGVAGTFAMVLSGINQLGNDFTNFANYGYNPITFLYHLGQDAINVTVDIWIFGGIMVSANVLLGAFCAASNPYGFAAQALIEWVKPLFMMVAVILWGAGFFLSYYVPLYPFMIFLFAALGWFISVIEAMVAAPLVALNLAHPENHDLLGKAEQAVMLLLGVFIQPSLLVVGLIAGIIVSFVSFQLLIYAFSGFMMDIMGTPVNTMSTNILAAVQHSPLSGGSVETILIQPLLLAIFCMITYTLLTQSFSLVYVLRDNVMKWIGAPASGLPSPDQLAGETRGAISGAGSRMGQAAADGSMGQGQSQNARQATSAIQKSRAESKSSEVKPGD